MDFHVPGHCDNADSGVAKYLENKFGPKPSGVDRYLEERQEAAPVSGVAKYVAQQKVNEKGLLWFP